MRNLLLLACLLAYPSQSLAQDGPGRMMLEAGLVGGNSAACPGHYLGIEGHVAGPASVYGMVENYRCVDLAGASSRLGISVLLGRRIGWFVRRFAADWNTMVVTSPTLLAAV